MKKILLIVFVLVVSLSTVQAQKNTILVYGNIGYNSTTEPSSNDKKTNNFTFSPGIGYQFTDNLTAGIAANIGSGKETTTGILSTTSTSNIFTGGPFVRYAHKLSDLFFVYGQLEGQFGGAKLKQTVANISTETKFKTVDVNLFPAVFINLKNSFGLNFSIGGISYSSFKADDANAKANTEFNFSFGKSANIGISKNF
jgi:long-subunit fatty acid transport protein